jgi:hypothetical protein
MLVMVLRDPQEFVLNGVSTIYLFWRTSACITDIGLIMGARSLIRLPDADNGSIADGIGRKPVLSSA